MTDWADEKARDISKPIYGRGYFREGDTIVIAQALRDVAAEKDKEIALLEKTVSAREGSAIALATASRTEIERLRRENNSLRGQPND